MDGFLAWSFCLNMNSRCKSCSKTFQCNAQCRSECWCIEYPAISHFDDAETCYCPHCLPLHIATQLETFIESNSTDHVIKFAKQYEDKEPIEHIDYTVNNGDIIFTKWFHLKRGDCCENGCVNCPF